MINDLLGLFHGHVVALRQFLRHKTCAALFKAEQENDFFLCQQPVQNPEIHVVFLHAARELPRDIIRNHQRQLLYQLRLFRIFAAVLCLRIIPLVHVYSRIYFLNHFYPQ